MKNLPNLVGVNGVYVDNKYTKWYLDIIKNAQNRSTIVGYIELHHIIPESFYINRNRAGLAGWLAGNPDDVNNIVKLTAREHCIAHMLLIKMTTGIARQKCTNAAWRMCSQLINGKRHKINSRLYSYIREEVNKLNRDRIFTKEMRRKMSEAKKGKSPPNKGKPHTEETKEKLRIARANQPPMSKESLETRNEKLRNPSAETLEKMRKASTGRVVTLETRTKISKSHQGMTQTQESIEKIKKARAQQVIPAEAYARAAEKRRGRKHSEESKEKMRQARANRSKGQPHSSTNLIQSSVSACIVIVGN